MKDVTEVRVVPGQGGDPDGFRERVRQGFRGDVRPRPYDCTGVRYLVRRDALPAFEAQAARFGLAVAPDRHGRRISAPAGRPSGG